VPPTTRSTECVVWPAVLKKFMGSGKASKSDLDGTRALCNRVDVCKQLTGDAVTFCLGIEHHFRWKEVNSIFEGFRGGNNSSVCIRSNDSIKTAL